MTDAPGTLARAIVDACLAMGFELAGIAPAAPSDWQAEFRAWLASGKHGDMAYMTEMLDDRLDVTRLLPGVKSVIMVADRYAPRTHERETLPDDHGVIARYARGRDYHRVMNKRLHMLADRLRERAPGAGFRVFVDSGPVLEREQAVRAGMVDVHGRAGGFIGKHTLMIHPTRGSWLLLGGIATTLELAWPSAQPGSNTDACGSCTRCIDACPTGAITPFSVDATRCISYLTLEHAGAIDEQLMPGMGRHLAGCDICQEVCPFNRPSPEPDAPHTAYTQGAQVRASVPLLEVLSWSESDRSRVLSQSAAKRATLEMLKRSALIALGNAWTRTGDDRLRGAIERVRDDDAGSAMLRETAARVLRNASMRTMSKGPSHESP